MMMSDTTNNAAANTTDVSEKVFRLMQKAVKKGYGRIEIVVTPDWIKVMDTTETYFKRQ